MAIAVRTPLYHSWKDPAERVMSSLNLALQAVGLSREKLHDANHKKKLSNCKNTGCVFFDLAQAYDRWLYD